MPWLAIDVVSFITFFGISFTCDGLFATDGILGIPVYTPKAFGRRTPTLLNKSLLNKSVKKLMINIYNI